MSINIQELYKQYEEGTLNKDIEGVEPSPTEIETELKFGRLGQHKKRQVF